MVLAKEGGDQTLAQQEDNRKEALRAEVAAHPFVKSVMETFPDAEIETIRNLDDDQPMGAMSFVVPGAEAEEKHMKNLGQMMKQAQEMQSKMTEMQDKLADIEVTGSSGGGMVEYTLTGKNEARRLKIDPSLLTPDSAEMLEDLIVAAANDARSKVETKVQEKMSELTGGLQLPPGFQATLLNKGRLRWPLVTLNY